jgi:protein-disulfide isomerase
MLHKYLMAFSVLLFGINANAEENINYKEEVGKKVSEYEQYVSDVREFETSGEYAAKLLFQEKPFDVIIGDSNAPVTVVEYASLSCTHCKQFHDNVYYDLKKNYIDKGKVKFIYRNYPLNGPALKAATILSCVDKTTQAAFIGALFKGQAQWAFVNSEAALIDRLKTISKIAGMTTEQFNKCYDNEEIQEQILELMKEANQSLKVESTPTIFVDGIKYLGARTYEAFSKAVDERIKMMEKAKEKLKQGINTDTEKTIQLEETPEKIDEVTEDIQENINENLEASSEEIEEITESATETKQAIKEEVSDKAEEFDDLQDSIETSVDEVTDIAEEVEETSEDVKDEIEEGIEEIKSE